MTNDDYDKGEHVKETFAYFGRAYYMANVFETGLALAILHLDFLKETMEAIKRAGRRSFNQAKYEEAFDVFMERQHAQTLGNLIKRAQGLADMDMSLKRSLAEVKVRRDFLAHHFFRDRSTEFASRSGRDKMISELETAHGLFFSADRALSEFMGPHRKRLGLSDEIVEAQLAKYLKELAQDD